MSRRDDATGASDPGRDRTPVIRAEDLRKEFGDLVAVTDASFSVRDGEFFSIIGPSGSGKTTLLRMLAGFEAPTSGAIYLEGRECTYDKPYHRSTNMIFQDLALFPHLDVAGNIGFGLVEAGVAKAAREERIREVLEVVDLEGYGGRDISELSGGEQQRVALARGLVNEPSVLLLDEPLASLDERLKERMKVELKRIQDRTNTTFIYVTHDQEVAMAMSDRIAVLRAGRIQQVASPEAMYTRPANTFVADFTGAQNLLDVTVTGRDGDTATVGLGGHSLTAALTEPARAEPDAPVRLVIRPEDIQIADGDTRLRGTISDIVYKGALVDLIVDVDLGDRSVPIQAEVYAEDVEAAAEGDTVGLTWRAEKALAVIEA